MKMRKFNHTPGPWVNTGPNFGYYDVREDPPNWNGGGYQHICSVPSGLDFHRKNAELIAAAPEMLDLLVKLYRLESWDFSDLTEVLAKALGCALKEVDDLIKKSEESSKT